jgi:predicted lipase
VQYPNAPFLVTGHSLGAAIATLTAAHLLADFNVNPASVSLYTFGSPRVGDRAFADWFDGFGIAESWCVRKCTRPTSPTRCFTRAAGAW